MKKIYLIALLMFLLTIIMFSFSSCNKKEVDIELVEEVVCARFSERDPYYHGETLLYNSPISFEAFEKTESAYCPSRSFYYAKFKLTFNNTPQDYNAYELYEINNIIIDGNKCACRTRAGEKYNQIEIIVVLPYFTDQNSHVIQAINYTCFDSVKGEKVQKNIETDYNFKSETIPNYINRYDKNSKFNITKTETNKTQVSFAVETNIDYDKLIYNVTKKGRFGNSYEFKALVNEAEYKKSDLYTIKASNNEYYYYVEISIVGYQKDGVNYYFSPFDFSVYS